MSRPTKPVASAGAGGRRRVICQEAAELRERPGVDDVASLGPAPLGGSHAEAHVVEVGDGVGVGGDDEPHAEVARPADELVADVEV